MSLSDEVEVLGLFKEDEFETAMDELDTPQVEGWDLFVDSLGVTIYRLYDEESGLYHYKTYGELETVGPETCAHVYVDLDYRKQWDSYCKILEVKECEGKKLLYWQLNFPFPMWNRDYVFGREFRVLEKDGRKTWIVLAKSMESPSLPVRSGVVRVDRYMQSAVLCTNGKGGTKAFIRYFDNPGGNIPKWFLNWAAKTAVPQFLKIMRKACEGYEDYKQQKQKEGSS
ncbi:phosphatidylcholine transfer protein [Plakobranchus ocellatus]|uniref:Phosphatidylcholine transfer protein n=1 Tax=Plakobranchus ocellatus TaxID=259542 RepID=A0AAV4DI61_9GAST|nr:phosphatidylcholine transfer protein [Plakobranchus ocellatus]